MGEGSHRKLMKHTGLSILSLFLSHLPEVSCSQGHMRLANSFVQDADINQQHVTL